ncbi:MAG: hypothetical protein KDD52_10205, partial [Bdellovibrionales bacterium]|nr:hypothetical protein [Bdellovibrionales bacterium]
MAIKLALTVSELGSRPYSKETGTYIVGEINQSNPSPADITDVLVMEIVLSAVELSERGNIRANPPPNQGRKLKNKK